MKYLLLVLLLAPLAALHAADLTLTSPRDFQVVQRATPTRGLLKIAGQLAEPVPGDAVLEARLVGAASDAGWQRLNATFADRTISGVLDAATGGWWRLEVRVSHGGKAVASGAVEHVGVGEVFVIAGQSNSANHGQEKQKPPSARANTKDQHKRRTPGHECVIWTKHLHGSLLFFRSTLILIALVLLMKGHCRVENRVGRIDRIGCGFA